MKPNQESDIDREGMPDLEESLPSKRMMARGSNKHGPHLDEEMKRETRSITQGAPTDARAEEFREIEGPAEGEPTPGWRLRGSGGDEPEGTLTHDEIEWRRELARHLHPSAFPADRRSLLASATEMQAPDAVLRQLGSLPDRTFTNVEDIWEALGFSGERRE